MYPTLLALHSFVRWLVLVSLLFAIYRAYRGWLAGHSFSRFDDSARLFAVNMVHLQLTLGLGLYYLSPLVDYFLDHFEDAVHDRQIRFFGLEHSTMMLTAIIVITIGSARAKRQRPDREKFKTLAIWFTIALILIFFSIPWAFSPLVSRPYFRAF